MTGIRRSPAPVREWPKKPGLAGANPAQADPVAQQLFLDAELTPVFDAAKAGRRQVFFVDAAYFVLGTSLGSWWCLTRLLLPTPSGRQCLNGHAVTHEVITVTNDTDINLESVVTLLNQLVKRFTDLPIPLVLDNARYQCQASGMSEAERGDDLAMAADVFTQPQSHRTAREVCEARRAMQRVRVVPPWPVLSEVWTVQPGDQRVCGRHQRQPSAQLNTLLTRKFPVFKSAA